MKDDLLERLRTVDPVTDERIAQETRALGNAPGRIAEHVPTNVRRFPTAARRKATLVAVAAVVVVAIALPLTLLRSLGNGDGDGAPADDPGNWVAVGTLAEITPQGVVYRAEIAAFLMGRIGGEPLALSAADPSATGQRAIYCAPSDRFLFPAGDVFDADGVHVAGPGTRGLDRLAVRVRDGLVEVDPSSVTPAASTGGGGDVGPQDLGCQTANGIPLEGELGFAIPNGPELPPIAVALPQRDTVVQSPVVITGSANVFEATVSIRVLDETGTMIAEAFTTATCGTGCRGDFSADLDFAVDHDQPGTVQVFESSAMDGSMINTVEIPVTLVPGAGSATTGVDGTWFDANDEPLPDGSPDAVGTVFVVFRGAEHCQWESASFMHMGWPIGTVSNAPEDWRQFVRDPKSLFDDGALHMGYLSDMTLPSDATDTGYHRGPWQLWVSPSQADDAVFVVDADTGSVERWGRATPPILCA
jgi:hypothetical protein